MSWHPLTEVFIEPLGLAIAQLVISLEIIQVDFSEMDLLPHSKEPVASGLHSFQCVPCCSLPVGTAPLLHLCQFHHV